MLTTAAFLFLSLTSGTAEDDPRTFYDVKDYRIDLLVGTESATIRGFAGLTGQVTAASLEEVVVDLDARMLVQQTVWVDGDLFELPLPSTRPVPFERRGDLLAIRAPEVQERGQRFALLVYYSGSPRRIDDFTGFHFARTPDGKPWISTSCQTIGAQSWWPCKASYFHPRDKNERLMMNITVPKGLYAACNGRLQEIVDEGTLQTFRWQHDYPQPTYSVAMNIGPYVVLEDRFELPGLEAPVEIRFYALPVDADRARKEFGVLRRLLIFYSEKFGPYPFPGSKFAFAQTPIWGMEHSTVIAYGNSFPASLAPGEEDPFAVRNRLYDYILVHESAHEWWGNCITAGDWGDFWLHEGFATYCEALWVEHEYGLETYLDFMRSHKRAIDKAGTVFRPNRDHAGDAYSEILYEKGSLLLHMLRYVMGDEGFFAAVRGFATDPRFRYGSATSMDFQRICEQQVGRSLRSFFQPWLFSAGWPHYTVREARREKTVAKLSILCRRDSALFPLEMPLDVTLWCADGSSHTRRVSLRDGENQVDVEAPADIVRVEYPGFRWILCDVSYVP